MLVCMNGTWIISHMSVSAGAYERTSVCFYEKPSFSMSLQQIASSLDILIDIILIHLILLPH